MKTPITGFVSAIGGRWHPDRTVIPCAAMRNIAILAALIPLAACNSVKPCDDRIGAFVMAQEFVKKALKAPSTAQFPLINADGVSSIPTTTPDGKCAFSVVTYVDAQNSFGAMIREKYAVTVSPDGNGTWTLVEFTDLNSSHQTPVN